MAKNQAQVEEFAGLCQIIDGVLVSPTVYSAGKTRKVLLWKIYVGLSDGTAVEDRYIAREELPEGVGGTYWTKSGMEGGAERVSDVTTIMDGKNTGSRNYTTPFTQAVLEARSEYNKKIRKGGVLDRSKLRMPGDQITIEDLIAASGRKSAWRVFPMALQDLRKHRDRLHYPAFVQPKYDGVLFVVVSHEKLPPHTLTGNDGKVQTFPIDGYSRGGDPYDGQDHILLELAPILKDFPGLYLVGELYKAGIPLQEISGSSRRQADSKVKTKAIQLDYYIFDAFYLHATKDENQFKHRYEILQKLATHLENAQYVKIAPTFEVNTDKEMQEQYEKFLQTGHEGAVVRNTDSPYEYGMAREIRSLYTLKMKPREDQEFPVINFKEGKNGKEVGAVIWICAENDAGVQARTGSIMPLDERLRFAVTPNLTYEQRYSIWTRLSEEADFFKNNIYGKDYTVEYSILSSNNLPQQPKGKGFRDQTVNELLLG